MNFFRLTYIIILIAILLLFSITIYLEMYQGMLPCPLCLFQRVFLGLLGIIVLIALLLPWNKKNHLFLNILRVILAIGGIIFAGRQVWLQHFPPHGLGECGVSLQYLLKMFSFTEAVQHVWQGGVECVQYTWEFLHLSLAEWSLAWFVVFFILLVIQVRRIK